MVLSYKYLQVSLRLCVSSVMHCCWVRAGLRKVKTLTPVVEWILNTIGMAVAINVVTHCIACMFCAGLV